MDCTSSSLPYGQTGYFSNIALDYVAQSERIQPFFTHPVSLEGMRASITERRKFNNGRQVLHALLKKQYEGIETHSIVEKNIESLLSEDCFTICTAHQPNIFTGPLYFIYKIIHAIKIADWLNTEIPDCHFVPVYYMGSEDADLEELGHININGEKYSWNTSQTGAVGRMKVDKELLQLLDTISGQILVQPHGQEIIQVMKDSYTEGRTIEQATFRLVNELHGSQGLLIVLPDQAGIKAHFTQVIERELMDAFSHSIVETTVGKFPESYKVQASGRAVNMFYLLHDKRERIENSNGEWSVVNTDIKFTRQEMLEELKSYPERFSPNVILRPVLQEWILPNIAFIGGGGEIAYWLQLKEVFAAAGVPYPMLILRNSFLYVDQPTSLASEKLGLTHSALFLPETELLNQLVKKNTTHQLSLEKETNELSGLYDTIQAIAAQVDPTLKVHASALQKQALKKLKALEKKILRAEKKKFAAESRQLKKIKTRLFPNNNLQERVDNLMPYYANMGNDFFKMIYMHAPLLEQQFTILTEKRP